MSQRDKSSNLTNPQLKEAMQARINEDTEKHRRAFYQALLRSALILPVARDSVADLPPGEQVLSQDTPMNLATFRSEDGEPVLIAFTDEEAVLAWKPEGMAYVALHGADLFPLLIEHPVAEMILNPGGPVRARLTRAEIAALAQSRLEDGPDVSRRKLPAGARVMISAPDQPLPPGWQAEVRAVLKAHPDIIAAYLFQLQMGESAPQLTLGLQLKPGIEPPQHESVMRPFLQDLRETLTHLINVEFIILEHPDFRRTVADTVPPLYRSDL